MSEVQLDKQPKVPDTITLPEDEESLRRLEKMLEFHKSRSQMQKDSEDSAQESINRYKEIVLGVLLIEGSFDVKDFLRAAEYSEEFDEEAAHEAIRLISDNCKYGLGDSYQA